MSNKYIQENANEYCRPSLDDDDYNFFPYQGMLPIYCFKNNVLEPTVPVKPPLYLEENYYIRKGSSTETVGFNNYLYLCTFFSCMILLINFFK
jgi:hypothetical protein